MSKDIYAFPYEEKVKRLNSSGSGSEVITTYHAGMTLRDYFAAKALEGMISVAPFEDHVTYEFVAKSAYEYADAMLATREVKHEHD